MGIGAGTGDGRDRNVDEVSPFCPASVVVAHLLVPEQLPEHEPRVRAPLADAAVRDDLLVVRHALASVELLELAGGLERPVVADGARPGDRHCRPDVARALRALLLVTGRRDEVAGEL